MKPYQINAEFIDRTVDSRGYDVENPSEVRCPVCGSEDMTRRHDGYSGSEHAHDGAGSRGWSLHHYLYECDDCAAKDEAERHPAAYAVHYRASYDDINGAWCTPTATEDAAWENARAENIPDDLDGDNGEAATLFRVTQRLADAIRAGDEPDWAVNEEELVADLA